MRAALILGALALAGCHKSPDRAAAPATPDVATATAANDDNAVTYWQDDKTTCWYIVWQSQMTPQLLPSGRPRCGDDQ